MDTATAPYSLVIVESAAKSKTIQKYLQQCKNLKGLGPFKVTASLGHILQTPPKELGIDTDTWEVTYEPIATKKKVLTELKTLVKGAKGVYLASDPDREGEAIAWHLERSLRLKNPKRIVFHEITPKALETALLSQREIDRDLVASQETRVVLDKLVGFKVSPLLWKRFTSSGLSAGRVQSVVLRNIVERFKQYEEHTPEAFWTVEGLFQTDQGDSLETELYDLSTKKKQTYEDPDQPRALLPTLPRGEAEDGTGTEDWTVQVEFKKAMRNPQAPYTTSALQQEVYETYGFSAKTTMQHAQKLYEAGHITYMRTDSVTLSEESQKAIKDFLGPAYHPRTFKSKVANAQEAHECIRPTHFQQVPEIPDEGLRKVYDIIRRKTIASQMPPAVYTEVLFHFKTSSLEKKEFYGKASYLIEPGFLAVWQPSAKTEQDKVDIWKKVTGVKLVRAVARGNSTKPDGLYHEASIIKWMEKEGIGRPSTYASILEKLFSKGYVGKGANPMKSVTVEHTLYDTATQALTTETETVMFGGKEKDRLIPTTVGVSIVEYLSETIPTLMDYHFTADVEGLLDQISHQKTTKNQVLTHFYEKELLPVIQKAEEVRKAHPKGSREGTAAATGGPKAIQSFGPIDLVQTRYGPALFHTETKRFVSVTPFLQWRKKEATDLTLEDVDFLQRFPIVMEDGLSIEYGRYGLYLQHQKKNLRLPKTVWDSVYDKTYTKADLVPYLSPWTGRAETGVRRTFHRKPKTT